MILQIPEEALGDADDFSYSVHRHKGIAEITTSDVNQLIAELIEKKVSLSQMQVRSRNLDDLFLELTGKEIRA